MLETTSLTSNYSRNNINLMLTSQDLSKIKSLFKGFATKSDLTSLTSKADLKPFITIADLRKELVPVKSDLTDLQKELKPIKKDLEEVKKNLFSVKETAEFSAKRVVDILEWTQEIHDTIVREKLPERVRKLEKTLQTS